MSQTIEAGDECPRCAQGVMSHERQALAYVCTECEYQLWNELPKTATDSYLRRIADALEDLVWKRM